MSISVHIWKAVTSKCSRTTRPANCQLRAQSPAGLVCFQLTVQPAMQGVVNAELRALLLGGILHGDQPGYS